MLAAACSMTPRLTTDGAAAHRTAAALCDLCDLPHRSGDT